MRRKNGAHKGHEASLLRILALWFCGIAMLSCLAVGTLTYVVQSRTIRQQMYHQLESLRDEKAASITKWATEREADLRLAARRETVVRFFEARKLGQEEDGLLVREALQNMQDAYHYRAAFVADQNGDMLVTTEGKEVLTRNLPLRRKYIQAAAAQRDVVTSDVVSTLVHERTAMFFAAPVFSRTSFEVIGVVGVLVNLEAQLFPRLLSPYLGLTGEILLVNSDVLPQTPLRYRGGRVANVSLADEASQRAASGTSGRLVTKDYRPIEVMAAYGYVPKLRWGIVAKQDMAEINIPVWKTARILLLTVLGVLVVTALGGVFIARSISLPAQSIAEVSQKIGAGDFGVAIPKAGPVEMQTIAANLTVMVELLGQQRRFQEATSKILAAAGRHSSLTDLLNEVLTELMTATRSQIGTIYLGTEGSTYQRALVFGTVEGELPETIHLSPADHWLAFAAKSGEVQVIQEIPDDEGRGPTIRTQAGSQEPRSLLSIPVLVHDRAICIIGLGSVHEYRSEDFQVADALRTSLGQYVELTIATGITKRMARELDERNRELLASNRELEARSASLQEHTRSLRAQAVELNAQRTKVEAADRMKSQFLSTMSHELRTPLSAILSLSQMMIARGTGHNVGEEKAFLEVIERNGRELLQLINDILDLSKIEAGRMPSNITEFEPVDVVGRAVETIRPLAVEKKLAVEFCPTQVENIRSDENKLYRIVLNLLSNAVKFTDTGEIRILVDTSSSEPKTLQVVVQDTGIGVDPEEVEAIFDEFHQTDGSHTRRHEGSGLGLAISRKLAEILGGTLTVESVPGEGSSFTLSIPYLVPEELGMTSHLDDVSGLSSSEGPGKLV